MSYKPKGLATFIAWASVLVGGFCVAASIFGSLYLVLHGVGTKAVAYLPSMCVGLVIASAGIALLMGSRWSCLLYVAITVISIFPVARFIPSLLLLFGGVGDPAAHASLLFIAALALSSAKWVVASLVATFIVFRHFRNQDPSSALTLGELVKNRRNEA